MAFGSRTLMERLTFTIRRGDVFVIMGGSGSGKSTLMRHLVGLHRPAAGTVRLAPPASGTPSPDEQQALQRRFGIMYQQGALWTSMTLAENVALPIGTYTELEPRAGGRACRVQTGAGRARRLRRPLSVRDQRRHAQARRDRARMALDPEVLFLDEPSAGLDPISSRLLDDLILELRASLGMTIVDRHPRAGQHLHRRGQFGLPGPGDQDA